MLIFKMHFSLYSFPHLICFSLNYQSCTYYAASMHIWSHRGCSPMVWGMFTSGSATAGWPALVRASAFIAGTVASDCTLDQVMSWCNYSALLFFFKRIFFLKNYIKIGRLEQCFTNVNKLFVVKVDERKHSKKVSYSKGRWRSLTPLSTS